MQREWEIIGAPFDWGSSFRGSAQAPSAIRAAGLTRRVEHLQALGVEIRDGGDVVAPQQFSEDSLPRGAAEMLEYAPGLMERIDEALLAGKIPIVLGGDHSVSIPAISATADALRNSPGHREIGLVWVDAHPDLETPGPDSTNDLHAMAAAHLLDRGIPALRTLRGFAPKVKPENLIYVGLSDVVPEERSTIHELGITTYTISDVERTGISGICDRIFGGLSDRLGGFVVSLDVDAIDPCYAPGVDYAEPGGLTYREAMLFMEYVSQSEGLKLLEILEVNPLKDRNDTTSRLAARLIYRTIRGPVI